MSKNLAYKASAILFFIVFAINVLQIKGSFIPVSQDIASIGVNLFGIYVTPFELLSLILVGGIVGMFYITGKEEQ